MRKYRYIKIRILLQTLFQPTEVLLVYSVIVPIKRVQGQYFHGRKKTPHFSCFIMPFFLLTRSRIDFEKYSSLLKRKAILWESINFLFGFVGKINIFLFLGIQSFLSNTLLDRDVSTGATGTTAVAPKFSDTITYSQPKGGYTPERHGKKHEIVDGNWNIFPLDSFYHAVLSFYFNFPDLNNQKGHNNQNWFVNTFCGSV